MTDKQHNHCTGCRSSQQQCCIIEKLKVDGFLKEIVNCPCGICLVKSMCKNGCDDYIFYTARIEALEEKYDREH